MRPDDRSAPPAAPVAARHRPGQRLRPLIGLAILLAGAACDGVVGSRSDREAEIPRPDLGRMEAAARRQIEGQIATVDELLADRAAAAPARGAALGELGRLYHAYGLEDEAAVCYRGAERLDPAERSWPYLLGFLHQVRGDAAAAAAALERASRLAPDDPAILVRLARARFEAGELDAAEELFRSALKRHPAAAAAAHAGLARIAGARGRHAEEVERYEAALAAQPTATRLHYPLALAYKELGELETAEEHLARRGDAAVAFPDPLAAALDRGTAGAALHVNRAGIALAEGRHREAVVEYRLAVAADPGNATVRGELGMLLAAGGDLAGARRELEEARRLEPRNPSHAESLARVLVTAGEEAAALPLFHEAVALDPGRAAGHRQLAAALARTSRYPEARDSYDRALELDPASAAARLGRAEVLLELGRLSAAVEDLEAALLGEPDNARASLRLGEARQRLGEPEAALAAFETALGGRLEPLERSAALLGIGNLLAARGDLAGAVERYRQALAITPGLGQVEINLAGALATLGREDEAIGHYAAVLGREPSNLRARAYRGQLLLRRGRADEALADFDEIVAREPRAAAAHLGAAAALQAAGRWAEARRRLEEALRHLPSEPLLTGALARLLAACPEPAVRDGEQAIRLARELMADDDSPDHAETLAMGLAAAGRYEEAVRWQRQLLSAARSAGAPQETVARLRSNLELYLEGSPCCAVPESG